jgi:hypothetical protein
MIADTERKPRHKPRHEIAISIFQRRSTDGDMAVMAVVCGDSGGQLHACESIDIDIR